MAGAPQTTSTSHQVDLRHPIQSLRSWVYDTVIVGMTRVWYREVLSRLPMEAHVLDVGVGTATSLYENRDLIVSKKLRVTGVDYDEHYVITARDGAKEYGLESSVELVHSCIHEFHAKKIEIKGAVADDLYDAVYFSGSFMIIPNKVKALRNCASLLKSDEGLIYFTQTFEKEGFMGRYVTPWVKWSLSSLLTIDFGSVTFERDFLKVLGEADCEVVLKKVIHAGYLRSQVLVVARRMKQQTPPPQQQ